MITFLGDAGIDHYLDQDLKTLGGCALNVATHFKRNSKEPAQLIYPSSIADLTIIEHCNNEDIDAIPMQRQGELPCQEIRNNAGEKDFIKYHSGVLEGFKFNQTELEFISNISGVIVAPLFSQILPLIDQVIATNIKAKFFFDFHDCSDFDFDLNQILPYLKRSSFAQFGLGLQSNHMKDFLINSEHEVLITQGSGEIHYKNETFKPNPVDSIVDSTGAGDAFLGAFLATKSLKMSSEYAAKILQKIGSI